MAENQRKPLRHVEVAKSCHYFSHYWLIGWTSLNFWDGTKQPYSQHLMALRYITCGSQSSAQSTPLAAKHWLRQDQAPPSSLPAKHSFRSALCLNAQWLGGHCCWLVSIHLTFLLSFITGTTLPHSHEVWLPTWKVNLQCQSWSRDRYWSIHMAHLSVYSNEFMGWSESQVHLLRPNLVVSCESEFSTPFGCSHVSSQLLDGWDIFLYKPVKTQKMSILFCMSLPRSKKHLTGSHQQKSLHPMAKNGVTCLPHQIISKEMLYN